MKKLFRIVIAFVCLFTQPVFSEVDKDIDVGQVQTILTELCYNPGPIDGAWGVRQRLHYQSILAIWIRFIRVI